MILRVFWGRLIRMVGPRAAATATPVVVVTNWRRVIPLGLVMDVHPCARHKSLRGSVAARRHGGTAGAMQGRVRAKRDTRNNTTGRCTRSYHAALPTRSRARTARDPSGGS